MIILRNVPLLRHLLMPLRLQMKWAQRALLASLVSESQESAISPQDLPQDWPGPGC